MSVAFVNGAPQGILWHDKDNWTMYVSPYMVVNSDRFTKHYYAGSQRIASKIGAGEFNNLYDASKACVTAGQKDYAERLNLITQSRNDYYAALGIPPGPPTAKGIYGEAEYSGAYGDYSLEPLGNYDVPTGWPMTPYKRPYGGTPGPPVMYEKPSDPEEEGAGYGYSNAEHIQEKDVFFYHSDHLGSTSYITDKDGNATQFVSYKPYGEALVDEHATSYEMPWKFNGKELDSETGLYYYGARYYEPVLALWYSVDAMAEKYPNMGGSVYCVGNPVKFVDPDGNDGTAVVDMENHNITISQVFYYNQNDRAISYYLDDTEKENVQKFGWSNEKSWQIDVEGEVWNVTIKISFIGLESYEAVNESFIKKETSNKVLYDSNLKNPKTGELINASYKRRIITLSPRSVSDSDKDIGSFIHEQGHSLGLHDTFEKTSGDAMSYSQHRQVKPKEVKSIIIPIINSKQNTYKIKTK